MQSLAYDVPGDPVVDEFNDALSEHLADLVEDFEGEPVTPSEVDRAYLYAAEAVLRERAQAAHSLSPDSCAALAAILACAIERLTGTAGPLPACLPSGESGARRMH